jgi:hypothetical protein
MVRGALHRALKLRHGLAKGKRETLFMPAIHVKSLAKID